MDDLEILFADVSSEAMPTSRDNTLELNSVPNSTNVTSQSQWCESCKSLAVGLEERYSKNFFSLKQKIFFTDNIIQMYEKCKNQCQEVEKAAQVANEKCNSMLAEKTLAQAQLNMMLADQEPVMKENKNFKEKIKMLESQMQTMKIELQAMDESRRLHEETIKVLRNEDKGELFERKKRHSQRMAQLREQLSDKTADNVKLVKTNKLLQRRVDKLEKKLRNAANYGLRLGEQETVVDTAHRQGENERIELTKINADKKRNEETNPPTSTYRQHTEDRNSSLEMQEKEMVAYITSTTATDESGDESTESAKRQSAKDTNTQVEKVLPNQKNLADKKTVPISIKSRMMDLKRKRILKTFIRRPSEKHLADLSFIVEKIQESFRALPLSTEKNKTIFKKKLNDELTTFCSKHTLGNNESLVLSNILKIYKNKFKISHLAWLQSELMSIRDGDKTINFSFSSSEESIASSQNEIVKHKIHNPVEENDKAFETKSSMTETIVHISPSRLSFDNSDKDDVSTPNADISLLEDSPSRNPMSSTAISTTNSLPLSNVLPDLSYSDAVIEEKFQQSENGNEKESKKLIPETAFSSLIGSSESDNSLEDGADISAMPQDDDFISVMPAIDDMLPCPDPNTTQNVSKTVTKGNLSSKEKHEKIKAPKTDRTILQTGDPLSVLEQDNFSSISDVPLQNDYILTNRKTRIARTTNNTKDTPVEDTVSSEVNSLPNYNNDAQFMSVTPTLDDLSPHKHKICNRDTDTLEIPLSNSGELQPNIKPTTSRSMENDQDITGESSKSSMLNLESEVKDATTMSNKQMSLVRLHLSPPTVLPPLADKRNISEQSFPVVGNEMCQVMRMRTRSVSAESEKSLMNPLRRSRRISEREESSSSSSEVMRPKAKKRRCEHSSSRSTEQKGKLKISESRPTSGTSTTKSKLSKTSQLLEKSTNSRTKKRGQKSILSPDSNESFSESSGMENLCQVKAGKNVDSSDKEESLSDMEIVEEKSTDIEAQTESMKLLKENETKTNQKQESEEVRGANRTEKEKLKDSIDKLNTRTVPQVTMTSSDSDIEDVNDGDLYRITEFVNDLLPSSDQNHHENTVQLIFMEFSRTCPRLSPIKSIPLESNEPAEPSVKEDVSEESLHIELDEEVGDQEQSDVNHSTDKKDGSDRESISPGGRQSISPSTDLCTAFNFSSATKTLPEPETDESGDAAVSADSVQNTKSFKAVSKQLNFKTPSKSVPPKELTSLKSKLVAFTSSCLSTDILQPRRFSCEAPQMAVTVPPIKPMVKTISFDAVQPSRSSSDKHLRKTSSLPLHRKECDIPAHWHTTVQIHSKDSSDSNTISNKTEIPIVVCLDETNKKSKINVNKTVQPSELGKHANAPDDISEPMEFDFDPTANSSAESEELLTPGIEFDAEQLLESISGYPLNSPLTGIDSEPDNARPSTEDSTNLPTICSPKQQDNMKKLTKITKAICSIEKDEVQPVEEGFEDKQCQNTEVSVKDPLQSQSKSNETTQPLQSQILSGKLPTTTLSLTDCSAAIVEIIASRLKNKSMEIEIDNSLLIARITSLLLQCVDYNIYNQTRSNDATLDDIPVAEQAFVREMIALYKTGVSDGKFLSNVLLPLLLKILINFGNFFPHVIDPCDPAKGQDVASLRKNLMPVLSKEKKSMMFSLERSLSVCRVFGFLCRATRSFSSLVDICRYCLIWQKYTVIVCLIQTLHCWTEGLKSRPLFGKSVLRLLRKMTKVRQIMTTSKAQYVLDQVDWLDKICGWNTTREEETSSSSEKRYSIEHNCTTTLDECMSRLSHGKLSEPFANYLKGQNIFVGSVFAEDTEEAIHCFELLPREYNVEYVKTEIINRRFWPVLNQWSQHTVIHGDVDEGRTVSNICIAALLEALTNMFSSYAIRQKQMHKFQSAMPHLQSYFVTICTFLDNLSKHYLNRAPLLVQCAAASCLLRTCFCNPKNAFTSLRTWLKATSNTSHSQSCRKHKNLNLLIQYSRCSEEDVKNICSYLDSKFFSPPESSLHSLLWPS